MRTIARTIGLCVAGIALCMNPAGAQDAPPLPEGLPATNAPALPEGLPGADAPTLPEGLPGGGKRSMPDLPEGLPTGDGDTPALPTGLGDSGGNGEPKTAAPGKSLQDAFRELGLTGFWDTRVGGRTQRDPYEEDLTLAETRLQLDWQKTFDEVTFHVVADLLYDQVQTNLSNVNLNNGTGWLDLRQANVTFSPTPWMDVRAGRQILTWGTGDMLFVNDLFPKDWVSFFAGRDVEYLKAPSDAIKTSFYTDWVNVNVVYVPRFDHDRYITGNRFSYYNRMLGRRAGQDAPVEVEDRDDCFGDDEWHVRLSKNIQGYELAAYGYWGYWKSPAGMDRATGRATFPRLAVYGGSVRGPAPRGIFSFEGAYYDSLDDRTGDDPFVDNSQVRLLAGWETDLPEIADDLTVGFQYYLEYTLEHDELKSTAPAGTPIPERDRQVLTCRITKLLLDQRMTASLFAYYSPTDNDAYLRPSISYKFDDQWTWTFGGNVFFGAEEYTFFGQFERNSSIYMSLRYGF